MNIKYAPFFALLPPCRSDLNDGLHLHTEIFNIMENEPCFQIPKAWHYEKTDRARQGNRRERKKLCKYILNITTNNLVAILNAIKKALTTALVRE